MDSYRRSAGLSVFCHNETDHYWRYEAVMNAIKMLTESLPPGARRYIAYDLKGSSKPFDASGKSTVFLTNKDILDARLFAQGLYESGVKPILSRCQPFVMRDSHGNLPALYEYAAYLAVVEGSLKKFRYSRSIANDALRYFGEHFHRQPEISVRRLEQIARTRATHGPERDGAWEAILQRSLTPPPTTPLPVPRIYQIDTTPRPKPPEPAPVPAPVTAPVPVPVTAPPPPAATPAPAEPTEEEIVADAARALGFTPEPVPPPAPEPTTYRWRKVEPGEVLPPDAAIDTTSEAVVVLEPTPPHPAGKKWVPAKNDRGTVVEFGGRNWRLKPCRKPRKRKPAPPLEQTDA